MERSDGVLKEGWVGWVGSAVGMSLLISSEFSNELAFFHPS